MAKIATVKVLKMPDCQELDFTFYVYFNDKTGEMVTISDNGAHRDFGYTAFSKLHAAQIVYAVFGEEPGYIVDLEEPWK